MFTGGERKDDCAHVNNILSSFHIYQIRRFLETLITLIIPSMLSFEEVLSGLNPFPILNRITRAKTVDKIDFSPCMVTGTLLSSRVVFYFSPSHSLTHALSRRMGKESCLLLTWVKTIPSLVYPNHRRHALQFSDQRMSSESKFVSA